MTSRLRVAPKTCVQSSSQVIAYISAMSAPSVSRMPGRWTLTATRSPLWRTARWTWPIDAAANDCRRERAEDGLGLGRRARCRMIAATSAYENGRDLVQELEQLVAVGGRQQVEPEREHLPELDPGAAESLEREPEPDRPAPPVGAGQVERRARRRAGRTWRGRARPGAGAGAGSSRRAVRSARVARRPVGRRPGRRRAREASQGRSIATPSLRSTSSSIETRRRRGGRDVSSSHSRPASTSSANVRRDEPVEQGDRALGGELGLAPVADADAGGSRSGAPRPRRSVSARLRCRRRSRVCVALLVGRALEPGLAALALARGPGVDLGLGRLGRDGARRRRPRRPWTVASLMFTGPCSVRAPVLGPRVYASRPGTSVPRLRGSVRRTGRTRSSSAGCSRRARPCPCRARSPTACSRRTGP